MVDVSQKKVLSSKITKEDDTKDYDDIDDYGRTMEKNQKH